MNARFCRLAAVCCGAARRRRAEDDPVHSAGAHAASMKALGAAPKIVGALSV
ncbi:MAG: hypothetical protein ABIX12_05890 [Rubrivivax sp.]